MMAGNSTVGRILVVGSSNTDLVCLTDRLPLAGETVASYSFAVYPGGKAANQAVAAARAGATVTFVGCFGDDDYGRERRSEMDAEGIDLSHAVVVAGEPSGLALIAVDPAGENLIITVGGANDHISVEQFDRASSEGDYSVILLPNEAPADVVRRVCSADHGDALVVLNAAPFDGFLRDIAPEIDVLICNEIEAAQFLGREASVERAVQDVEDLAARAGRSAIITVGEAGAVGSWNGQTIQVPAHPVDVVDTTGCGDAFSGAFAAWLARGATFKEALSAGVAAGSLAAATSGAQPSLPDEHAVRAILQR